MVPRQHGAWYMVAAPFICAAILAKSWSWYEVAAAAAVLLMFLVQEPLATVARQQFRWNETRPEASHARRLLVLEGDLILISGAWLLLRWPAQAAVALIAGALAFSALAVTVTVKNRQRSPWFQIASAIALTSSALAACLSALGYVAPWCWWLWGLSAAQAAAGILVVHARLEARVAVRKNPAPQSRFRIPAVAAQVVLLVAAIVLATRGQNWIAGALLLAAACYLWELRRQKDPAALKTPLTTVGTQTLTLSLVYSALIVVGLW